MMPKAYRLDGGVLLDSESATIVATFTTYGVIDVPCTAVGANSEGGHCSFVVSTTLGGAGL